MTVTAGRPYPMGAKPDDDGVNFAVFSDHASQIDLCLFSPGRAHEDIRIPLRHKSGSVWHGHVAGLQPGALYGYRAHGPYKPEAGHRFNPHKLLMDPYARELHGAFTEHPSLYGFTEDNGMDRQDSAAYVPRSVVSSLDLWTPVHKAQAGGAQRDLIYEAHVKGVSKEHPEIPQALRGTYEALTSDAILSHLKGLNVGALELLPVHAFLDDAFLQARGLRNYWGYNSIGFFAPEPRYFGPNGLRGFRDTIARLKREGICVILDVVYNHTAEGDHNGPTLSMRGLDNAAYYRLHPDDPSLFINDTGCGNTLNITHPHVLRLVMDSLRFWVEIMGVDGFRFDLATVLGRETHGFDQGAGFFDALMQDPVLCQAIMIAEPWDIGPGGYQLGAYPNGFKEWNDHYRDTVRRFWRGDPQGAQSLAGGLLGTAQTFDHSGRSSAASINFITSHDGFTLADVTRYNDRHNRANTENNADGHHTNYSDNCGVEGETDDPEILARRARRQRNLLATLFVSQGTPMMLAGDEIGNSQAGNNNAYCQDNPLGWVNWQGGDDALHAFVRKLTAFRAETPVLRQSRFLHGRARLEDQAPDVAWMGFDGAPVDWDDASLAEICLIVRRSAEAPEGCEDMAAVLVAFNHTQVPATLTLPRIAGGWARCIDTARTTLEVDHATTPSRVAAHSVVVFRQRL